MTTLKLWLNLILCPQSLDKNFINENLQSENELFDLMVYLINNGMSLLTSLSSISNNADDPDTKIRKEMQTKKVNIIKFLVFKLLSYLKWDLERICNTLPSIHQEFAFTEFKKFSETENATKEWQNFASILYHRWVLHFVLKSKYPTKPTRIGIISSNQQLLDLYFVPPEVQDSLLKKLQSLCLNSVTEIENTINELNSGHSLDVNFPLFDCFDATPSIQLKYHWEKAEKLEKSKFLDDIYYELGKWYFLHEDYPKANSNLGKIKSTDSHYKHLDGYKVVTQAMVSKNFKINDKENENLNKKILDYIQTILVAKENVYDFDAVQFTDFKKLTQVMKKCFENHKSDEERFVLERLNRYLIFKLPKFYDQLDQNNKSLFLDFEKPSVGNDENEVIEEGEINADEDLTGDEDPELMLLEAIEPEVIINLIPLIKRDPFLINKKWFLPNMQPMLFQNMSKIEFYKCCIILAKANELRNAKYFSESRTLYLSLLEDIQASNPPLAQMIRCELLHTDLEIFFNANDIDERMVSELEYKCVQIIQSNDMTLFPNFNKVMELACLFLLEYRVSVMKEFANSQIEILRFSACLAILTSEGVKNDKKGKELCDFIIGLFMAPSTKYTMSFPRITFSSSFAEFACRFQKSLIHNVIATCLVKIYNIVRDNPSQTIVVCPQYDSFPVSLPSTVINVIDIKSLTLVIEEILRSYSNQNQNNVSILKYYAEFLLCEGNYAHSLKYFILLIMNKTSYFTGFEYLELNETIIYQLITCCGKLGHHTQSAIFYQFFREPDYGLAFKDLSHTGYIDSTDDLYEYIWDLNLLEYLVNLHYRRGEDERRNNAIKLISQLELNASNGEMVLKEAANFRKAKFFRLLAKLYI